MITILSPLPNVTGQRQHQEKSEYPPSFRGCIFVAPNATKTPDTADRTLNIHPVREEFFQAMTEDEEMRRRFAGKAC
jgi:hypothetical protein